MPKSSDSYFTDRPIIDAMLELWPEGPDLDPCFEEGCLVSAKQTYDIRRGEDGRLLPWAARNLVNPPWSDITSFAARCAASGLAGQECLLVVPVSSDTRWWHDFVIPHGTICLLNLRAKFWRPGATKPTPSLSSTCVVHFGPGTDRFIQVFGRRLGAIVRRVDAAAVASTC